MVCFALFIETNSGSPAGALRTVAEYLDLQRKNMAEAREAAVRDPELLHAEIKRAARMRADNSVLPREVRVPLAERDQAIAQMVQAGLGVPLDGVPAGFGAVERVLGLRSGRGGKTRDPRLAFTEKDIDVFDPNALHEAAQIATSRHARIARNCTELLCVWFPALTPSLMMTSKTADSKFLQVVQSASDGLNPEMYLATFAGLLAKLVKISDDEQLAEIEKGLRPEIAMGEMLVTQFAGDLRGVLSRLRPLPRLKLESVMASTTSRA